MLAWAGVLDMKGYQVEKTRGYYSGATGQAMIPHPNQDPIDAAKTEVELAEARFSERVRRVSDLGNQLAERAWSETKPLLLVTAAVATVATVAIGVAIVRSGSTQPQTAYRRVPKERSLLKTLALGLAAQVAKNVAQRLALGMLANARKHRAATTV